MLNLDLAEFGFTPFRFRLKAFRFTLEFFIFRFKLFVFICNTFTCLDSGFSSLDFKTNVNTLSDYMHASGHLTNDIKEIYNNAERV